MAARSALKHVKRIAVDVDEVLGALVPCLIKFHNHHYGTKLEFNHFQSYFFHEVWGGTREQTLTKMLSFWKSPFFQEFSPLEGAKETLNYLKSKYGRHLEFVIITSRDETLKPDTQRWLDTHFPGVFTELYFGNCGNGGVVNKKKSKLELAREANADLLIDDLPLNAKDCAQGGVKVFLFEHHYGDPQLLYPWNRAADPHDNITRVRGWEAVKELLEKEILSIENARTQQLHEESAAASESGVHRSS